MFGDPSSPRWERAYALAPFFVPEGSAVATLVFGHALGSVLAGCIVLPLVGGFLGVLSIVGKIGRCNRSGRKYGYY